MSIIRRIKQRYINQFWNIGFVEEGIECVISSGKMKIHWLKHDYKDRWFADPFILAVSKSDIVVLVEEFRYSTNIGRLAKLVVDRRTYRLKEMKIILDLPTHLSFPFIYYKDNDVMILPENGQSNTSTLYLYNCQTDILSKVSEVSKLALTDATIVKVCGQEYLFSTNRDSANGPKLQIYKFDSETLSINDKPIQEIDFQSNVSRNAGAVFTMNGIMYRPAQDCIKCYGNGIIIQQVEFNGRAFEFKDVVSLHSKNHLYDLGYHTLNIKEGLIVVDGHGRGRNRVVNSLIDLYKGF